VCLFTVFVFGASAALAGDSPGWELTSSVFPTNITYLGGKGAIEVNVFNTGAAKSVGPVTVTDVLPSGVVATEAGDLQNGEAEHIITENGLWNCTGNAIGESPREVGKFKAATIVRCVNSETLLPELPLPEITGTAGQEAGSGSVLHIGISVEATTGVSGTLTNAVAISGGGASGPASTSSPIVIGPAQVSAFGLQSADGWFSDAEGKTDTQASSHPFDFTFSFNLNTFVNEHGGLNPAGGEARDIAVNLPPGFIGNPTAIPQCTRQQFDFEECSPSTQVGIDQAGAIENTFAPKRESFPVYNLTPPHGIPAEFALDLAGVQTFLDANIRSGGNYGLVVHTNNIGNIKLMYNDVTFWGEPSDPLHDPYRYSKSGDLENGQPQCLIGCSSSAPRIPFLTLPTSCGEPEAYSVSANTWETDGFGEASFLSHNTNGIRVGFTGCDHLGFKPSISTAPDTSNADTPAGLTVDVRAPQEGLATTGALAPSDIKNTTVTLPAGIVINPGQASGLQECQYSESGLGVEPTVSEPLKGEPSCPKASKVGTDEAITPILFKPLTGNVYVLPSNPPHLKLLAALSGEGIVVKLVLEVELDEQTGQITTHVLNIPQAPVSNFKISLSGGAQAALATPTHCGTYQTTSDFTPWAIPAVGDVFPSSTFEVNSGTGGSACPPSALPFTPTLAAGSTTDQAGGYTDFSLLLHASDDQQRISKLSFTFPPGFTGELSKIALCTNAQAEANECPASSQIGHTTVASGPGPFPLVIPEPGQEPAPMYLTETYEGAPFGLSIVVPIHAGPFTLPTQRVRAKVEVNPVTTQLTITTNPLPQVVAGVPTDLRTINAIADRPNFIINPTNCDPQTFSGTATSNENANAPITSHFQVGSCQSLKFQPGFKVSTTGKTSKANGASLHITLTYPNVPQGTETNITRAKFDLPKQLPSRLTTLQKACTAAVFKENPAACPPASFIGHAKVITPLLPVPVEGPAIFVSHGGEAFPSLVFVLQGYGITVDVTGTTFISKQGITSTTFKTIPDVPFNTFETILPQGKYSALAANGNLCTSKLTMPTEFNAQNGTTILQTTHITVTGCPRSLTRAQKLAVTLKACHKDKKKSKRAICERQAHKKYGPVKANKKTKKKK
jgi:hypothetical protein